MDSEDIGEGGGGVLQGHVEIGTGRRVEVLSGVLRRRRWSRAEKAMMTGESFRPGVSVSDVARRHGVSLGLLHHWRRAARRRAQESEQTFVPVVQAQEPSAVGDHRPDQGVIEIEVDGVSIRLRGAVDGATLRTVLAAARRP